MKSWRLALLPGWTSFTNTIHWISWISSQCIFDAKETHFFGELPGAFVENRPLIGLLVHFRMCSPWKTQTTPGKDGWDDESTRGTGQLGFAMFRVLLSLSHDELKIQQVDRLPSGKFCGAFPSQPCLWHGPGVAGSQVAMLAILAILAIRTLDLHSYSAKIAQFITKQLPS